MAVQDIIYDKLHQVLSYHPGTVEIFDDFLAEAGDIVQVVSDQVSYDLPIFSQHMTWNGSMLTTMESTGNRKRNDLPPLQKKQKTSGYRAGQRMNEQEEELHGYYTDFINSKYQMGMIAGAIGVALDENGYPIVDEETGEFEWDDENGAEIYSRLLLSANRAQLISAINNGSGTAISGAKVDLSAQGAVLIQAINQNGTASVTIDADQINLEGVVTSSEMDTRLLNADALFTTAGYSDVITSAAGKINDLTVGTLRMTTSGTSTDTVARKAVSIGGTLSSTLHLLGTGSDSTLTIPDAISGLRITSSNNTYTLQKQTYSSSTWTDIGSFSRATTLTGGWSSGKFTVSASPQGESYWTEITQGATSWNGTTATVPVMATDSTSGGNSYATGRNILVDASSVVGVDTLVLNGPATGAYTDGTDQGTLTANRYYQVVATPHSGNPLKIKFKTPSSSQGYTKYRVRLAWGSYITQRDTYCTRTLNIYADGYYDGSWDSAIAEATVPVWGVYQTAEGGGHEVIVYSV